VRKTRITVSLIGWLVLFSLGLGGQAAGYAITPAPYYPAFLLEVDLAGNPAASYETLSQYEASMVNSDSINSAATYWSANISDVTEYSGAEGKTTAFSQTFNLDMEAQLLTAEAHLGRMVTTNCFFDFQPEAGGTAAPYPVELMVSWSGNTSNAYGSLALYKIIGWNMTPMMDLTQVYMSGSEGTQTFLAYLPEPSMNGSYNYDVRFTLIDEQDWAAPGNYSSSLSVVVKLKATEAGLTSPVEAPVPASLLLLGSGLVALWAKASWRKPNKGGQPLIGPS
jgi:hypothetical protein